LCLMCLFVAKSLCASWWLKDLFDDLESDEEAAGNSEAGHDIPER